MESRSFPFSFDIAGRYAKHRENKCYATANRGIILLMKLLDGIKLSKQEQIKIGNFGVKIMAMAGDKKHF